MGPFRTGEEDTVAVAIAQAACASSGCPVRAPATRTWASRTRAARPVLAMPFQGAGLAMSTRTGLLATAFWSWLVLDQKWPHSGRTGGPCRPIHVGPGVAGPGPVRGVRAPAWALVPAQARSTAAHATDRKSVV